jgi:hypothetical protein
MRELLNRLRAPIDHESETVRELRESIAKTIERVMELSGEYAASADPVVCPPSRLDLHIVRYQRNRTRYLRELASDIRFTTRAMRGASECQPEWWTFVCLVARLWANWIGLAVASASLQPPPSRGYRIRRIVSLLDLMDAMDAAMDAA